MLGSLCQAARNPRAGRSQNRRHHKVTISSINRSQIRVSILEKWSIGVIRSHWIADFGSSDDLSRTGERLIWTLGDIQELVFLSLQIDTIDTAFRKSIEEQWLARISNPKFGNSTIVHRTLTFADGLSSQRHRALAYYHTLRRSGILQLRSAEASGPFLEPSGFQEQNQCEWMSQMTSDQRQRLMHGLWCLVSLRGTYSLAHVGCADVYCKQGSGAGCAEAWKEYGASVSTSLDFGKLLQDAIHQLRGGSLPGGLLCASCEATLLSQLVPLLCSFEQNLVNYFQLDRM
ncbi:hypothetical protein D9756_005125 [Leucocoprinus leucothites]|uniref:Uncharacterized protein n=1 Tax=Leucocoprinus leucothites TaxID=201217 RepID=A0A8H5G9P8_9AGAR|nr:hypothetical protein D9756_005125 [Leucoagaricus leucothites]